MKLVFLTYGGLSNKWHNAVTRLCNQVKSFDMFDNIYGMTDIDLKNDDEFWNKHGKFIEQNLRGNGYWIWKSYLVLKTLKCLAEGDILLYLDAGFELNIKRKNELINLINNMEKKEFMGSTAGSNDIQYTKMDLIKYLDMNENKELLAKEHIPAGCLLLKKCDMIMKLIEEWYEICQNYHFIDDSPSILPNDITFIEHKHDQSVFNLLVKKYNMINHDLSIEKRNVIWGAHNKSGKSLVK